MAKATVVYWRDIPAQVIVKAGRKNAKRVLPERFEKAIDQAAMLAKLSGTDAYLEQWHRGEAVDCGDDLEAEAERMAAEIENTYPDTVLSAYIKAGGMKPES
ncbi:MAG: virulence factor [Pseudomonadota bacterium]